MHINNYIYLTFIFANFVFFSNKIAVEAVLNLHEELFYGLEADRIDWSKHPCRRNCTESKEPKTCEYVFVVEQFSAMSKACYKCPFKVEDCFRPHCIPANGVQKTVYVVNRQLPGPTIEICYGDVIAVEVRNAMVSESTTIHWHGIKQMYTPYMDGVPYVSQCPILPGEKFRYIYNSTTAGTFFWHSHIGGQRSDGLFGPLVIHQPRDLNPHADLYDYDDQIMIINDWANREGIDEIVKFFYDTNKVLPTHILVNGLGRYKKFGKDNETAKYIPAAVFKVQKGKRYRFRLIHAGSNDCPISVSIDKHTMLVISLDSEDIEPVEVDVVTIYHGERIDFILKANEECNNYWIRFRGYGECERSHGLDGIHQVAILRYSCAKDKDPKSPVGYNIPMYTSKTRNLNAYNTGTNSPPNIISIPSLNALAPNDRCVTEKVDQQIFLTLDFHNLNNYDYHRQHLYGYYQVPFVRKLGTFQLNDITYKPAPFPILSQRDMVKPHMLCNSSTHPPERCAKEYCACTHVLEVGLNNVVELVFIAPDTKVIVNHPLHLHGHFFRVIATEILEKPITVELFKKLDREGKIKRKLDHAPLKDTIKTPHNGYTIVRFQAINPAYWFFHCHFEVHNVMGMSLVFKVGEHKDFPPIPKNFPTCGSYLPNVM